MLCLFDLMKEIQKVGGSLPLMSKLLIEKKKVTTVPGVAFGADNFVRLSYANSLENIKKGLDRVEEFVRELN